MTREEGVQKFLIFADGICERPLGRREAGREGRMSMETDGPTTWKLHETAGQGEIGAPPCQRHRAVHSRLPANFASTITFMRHVNAELVKEYSCTIRAAPVRLDSVSQIG